MRIPEDRVISTPKKSWQILTHSHLWVNLPDYRLSVSHRHNASRQDAKIITSDCLPPLYKKQNEKGWMDSILCIFIRPRWNGQRRLHWAGTIYRICWIFSACGEGDRPAAVRGLRLEAKTWGTAETFLLWPLDFLPSPLNLEFLNRPKAALSW